MLSKGMEEEDLQLMRDILEDKKREFADIDQQRDRIKESLESAELKVSDLMEKGYHRLRNDAARAIGGNLTSLRKAMTAQKRFDQSTVKRVAYLVRILMQNGYLSGMKSSEMQKLLSAESCPCEAGRHR